jgi:hypothetical protein
MSKKEARSSLGESDRGRTSGLFCTFRRCVDELYLSNCIFDGVF